jgi:hypothetical protein
MFFSFRDTPPTRYGWRRLCGSPSAISAMSGPSNGDGITRTPQEKNMNEILDAKWPSATYLYPRRTHAVSPDGVIISNRSLVQSMSAKGLLEIKCPFSLKDIDVSNMPAVASSQFFTCDNGKLSLKRHHSYYFQIQLGMFVTGCQYSDFVI